MIDTTGFVTLQSLRKNLRDKGTVIENGGVEGDMITDECYGGF